MEHKQQPKEQISIERKQGERTEERTERRSFRIEVLEARVAPSAVWTD